MNYRSLTRWALSSALSIVLLADIAICDEITIYDEKGNFRFAAELEKNDGLLLEVKSKESTNSEITIRHDVEDRTLTAPNVDGVSFFPEITEGKWILTEGAEVVKIKLISSSSAASIGAATGAASLAGAATTGATGATTAAITTGATATTAAAATAGAATTAAGAIAAGTGAVVGAATSTVGIVSAAVAATAVTVTQVGSSNDTPASPSS